MFKGFQDTIQQFTSVPSIISGTSREAYSFGGVVFWLDAEKGTNTRTDLAAITRWEDRYGYVFTQGTAANQPRLQLANAAFNNRSTIDFYAQTRHLQAQVGPTIDPRYTLAIVFRRTGISTGTTNKITILGQTTGINTLSFCARVTLSSVATDEVGFTNPNTVYSYSTPDAFGTGSVILIANSSSIVYNGAIASVINGTSFQGFIATVISNSATSTSGTFELAEVLIFNRMLNSQQMIQLSNNLNNKYAIY